MLGSQTLWISRLNLKQLVIFRREETSSDIYVRLYPSICPYVWLFDMKVSSLSAYRSTEHLKLTLTKRRQWSWVWYKPLTNKLSLTETKQSFFVPYSTSQLPEASFPPELNHLVEGWFRRCRRSCRGRVLSLVDRWGYSQKKRNVIFLVFNMRSILSLTLYLIDSIGPPTFL